MLFSSISFLYFFLPLSLFTYLLTPVRFKNLMILFLSLLFFYLGEPTYLWLLVLVGSVAFLFGKLFNRFNTKPSTQNLVFILTLIILFSLLIYFKYFNFLVTNINNLFNFNLKLRNIALPLGISFYIFQASSYVIDVYRKDVKAQESYINFMAYLSFFPQLIAGPIVRYEDISEALVDKKINPEMMQSGILRFVQGLGKKVLLANALGMVIKETTHYSASSYWLIALAFTLQLYFDFSGYSDMAIGMGRLFGYEFLENFNYPFIASSISEFWRRWHISLGLWFKKYVYIPLGGNRVSVTRFVFNMMVVWSLTGIWHGAAWNFVFWGMSMGLLIVFERFVFKETRLKNHPLRILLTFTTVVLSFVIFQNDSLINGLSQIKQMFHFKELFSPDLISRYYWRNNSGLILVSMILATPVLKNSVLLLKNQKIKSVLAFLFVLTVMVLSTAALVSESFNPFLYFRF